MKKIRILLAAIMVILLAITPQPVSSLELPDYGVHDIVIAEGYDLAP